VENKKLVMIPGPTPVHQSILKAMSEETASFKDPGFVADFLSVNRDLKEMWKTEGEVFVIAGSGTLAMEMSLVNILSAGDPVLVVSHGFFGDRFVEICNYKNYDVDVLSSSWGQIVPLEKIEDQLKKKDYRALVVTHVDTSTGVKAPAWEIGKLLKDKFPDVLYILDGVCSTGGEKEYIDEMGVDILFTGSQKALGVPPGLAILWAGPKALEKRKKLGKISDYYIDFDKWLPIMLDPSKYFGTPPVNLIWALKEALRLIKEEGLENRFARHQLDSQAIQSTLEDMGFSILAEKNCRASTISNVLYPEGIDCEEFRKALVKEGVVVAAGLGEYAGRLFRLGHMGNIDRHTISSVLAALERTLHRLGRLEKSPRFNPRW